METQFLEASYLISTVLILAFLVVFAFRVIQNPELKTAEERSKALDALLIDYLRENKEAIDRLENLANKDERIKSAGRKLVGALTFIDTMDGEFQNPALLQIKSMIEEIIDEIPIENKEIGLDEPTDPGV